MTTGGRRLRCRSHDGGCGGRHHRHCSHHLRSHRLRCPAVTIGGCAVWPERAGQKIWNTCDLQYLWLVDSILYSRIEA